MSKSVKSMLFFGILSIIFFALYYFSSNNSSIQSIMLLIAILTTAICFISFIIFIVIFPYRYFSEHDKPVLKIMESKIPWGPILLIIGMIVIALYKSSNEVPFLTGINKSYPVAMIIIGLLGGVAFTFGLIITIERARLKKY